MNVKKYNHLVSAEKFLVLSIKKGLANSYDIKEKKWVKSYPEVTGYLLSYFSENFQVVPPQIMYAAEQLCNIQHKMGGYPSFNDKNYLYTFDTAQIMHGLSSIYKKTEEKKYIEVAKKCAEFILGMQIDNGAMYPVFDIKLKARYVNKKGGWGKKFSNIQVKNVEGLLLMYELTGDIRYKKSALKLGNFGKRNCDLRLTHPSAYFLEGMLALGEKKYIYHKLRDEIVLNIQPNGFLPYFKGLHYAYVSGSVQMAILLYKVGLKEHAYSILNWARKVQSNHDSGGLFQYANYDSSLNRDIHTEINSWGTKYFAQLERLFQEK